jgi:hypothetical protein
MFCGVQPFSDKVTFFSENNSGGERLLSCLYFGSCLAVLKRDFFLETIIDKGAIDMNTSLKAVLIAAAMVGFGASAHAEQVPSAEYGKKLFNDPSLGGATGSKSCATCHPSGKGLENAWQNPKLGQQINTCIAGALRGKPLPLESVEMKSLILYHQSLKPASMKP